MNARAIVWLFPVLLVACISYHAGDEKNPATDTPQESIRKLGDDSTRVQNEGAEELFEMGKRAIPSLINSIGSTETIAVAYWNPISSEAPPEGAKIRQLATEIYAYMIEIILSREEFVCDGKDFMFLCSYDNHAYYSFLLFDKKEDKMLTEYNDDGTCTVSIDDLVKVRRVYSDWWDRNKDKSIEQLRDDWKNGVRPLTGTDYKWS
jgi:hypothetical protein